jgi:hypothetical protein
MSSEVRGVLALGLLVGAAAAGAAAQPQPVSARLAGVTRDVACAPLSPMVRPSVAITVAGGQDIKRTLFGVGDAVIVKGGTAQGVRTGGEFFVRRVVNDNYTEAPIGGKPPISVHTAGVVQIVEAQTDVSVATVAYNCDGIMEGDFLEPFQTPALPAGTTGGTPDFTRPAQLILGDERRQMGGARDFMVINRGSDHGLRQGQELTIFRHTLADGSGPVATIGAATVHVVRPETSVVRIERSIDAVYVGDLVAIHR